MGYWGFLKEVNQWTNMKVGLMFSEYLRHKKHWETFW